jgi:hypothetical protein
LVLATGERNFTLVLAWIVLPRLVAIFRPIWECLWLEWIV